MGFCDDVFGDDFPSICLAGFHVGQLVASRKASLKQTKHIRLYRVAFFHGKLERVVTYLTLKSASHDN